MSQPRPAAPVNGGERHHQSYSTGRPIKGSLESEPARLRGDLLELLQKDVQDENLPVTSSLEMLRRHVGSPSPRGAITGELQQASAAKQLQTLRTEVRHLHYCLFTALGAIHLQPVEDLDSEEAERHRSFLIVKRTGPAGLTEEEELYYQRLRAHARARVDAQLAVEEAALEAALREAGLGP